MKICIAQSSSIKGSIPANIDLHLKFIHLAIKHNSGAIFFPELSLTGYEPERAKELATSENDSRLEVFQQLSDKSEIIIGLGLPTISGSKIRISMIIFAPNKPRQVYSKQILHTDEFPFFEEGNNQLIIKTNNKKIAPAICYESLQLNHAEKALKLGANLYLASAAKPVMGVKKAFEHYPLIAKQFEMPVLMANSVGFCDNFLSPGQSSVWNKKGELVGQLDDKSEGILVFDTETEEIEKCTLHNN
jgi:predicted amidohydrolase